MKIIIVDTTIHESLIGGAQTFLPGLIKGLIQKGDEVHLVAKGRPDERMVKQITESGVILHTGIWKKKALVEDAASVFAAWVNKINPDIYLVSVSADIGWVVLPYLNPAIATVAIGHTDSETFYLPARHYQPFITKAIGVSDEVRNHYISHCNFPADDVVWIPYGVLANPEVPVEHRRELLQLIYVGRLEEGQKRISDLIRIGQQLAASNIPFKLKIVGDGPEMPVLKNSLQKEIGKNKVELLGWLKTEEVIDQLRQSDLFLLTSAYEGFCIALIEAMANGCCPLVTDIKSGNNQLITSEQNGFIFPIGETGRFVEKIIALANNSASLYTLRKNAWETGKKYSIERMIEAYHDCFVDAVVCVKRRPRMADKKFPLMETCKSSYPSWMRRLKAAIQ